MCERLEKRFVLFSKTYQNYDSAWLHLFFIRGNEYCMLAAILFNAMIIRSFTFFLLFKVEYKKDKKKFFLLDQKNVADFAREKKMKIIREVRRFKQTRI